jgi:hypothetical protein
VKVATLNSGFPRKQSYIEKRCHIGLLISREKPGFKASKDRLTLLLGANAFGDLTSIFCHSVNPRALKNNAKAAVVVL